MDDLTESLNAAMAALDSSGFTRAAETLERASTEIDRLRAEVDALRENNHGWLRANGPGGWIDALRADAERYRWLRDGSNPPWVMQMLERYADNGSDFDAEVDAAMAQGKV